MAEITEIREHWVYDNKRTQVATTAMCYNTARVHCKKKEKNFAIHAQRLQQYFMQISEKTLSLILLKSFAKWNTEP